MTTDFPDGFWWGTGASSTQAEGAAPASDWLPWERAGHAPPSGNGNGFAESYAEDFKRFAALGLTHHRISIEWARIEPENGRRDPAAVEHYRSMLQAAIDVGISPWVCLHHFTLPAWLSPDGWGLVVPEVRERYWRRHCEFIAEEYGDLVFGWKPINEPIWYAICGFATGQHPPGLHDRAMAAEALEAIHLANFDAARILRQTGKPVTTIHGLSPAFVLEETEASRSAYDEWDAGMWLSWLRPMQTGELRVGDRLAVSVPDAPEVFDLVGFSYYAAGAFDRDGKQRPYPPDGTPTAMKYIPWSPGLGLVIDRIADELPGTPILVCEHGIGTDDDAFRCEILRSSLSEVAHRVARGVDVCGFFHWTGIDNYEWGWGYNPENSFGLFDVDRNPKPSADLMRHVATTNNLP